MYNKFVQDAWLTHAHTTSGCYKLSDVTQCCHNGCGSPYEQHRSYRIPAGMCVVSNDLSSISAFLHMYEVLPKISENLNILCKPLALRT